MTTAMARPTSAPWTRPTGTSIATGTATAIPRSSTLSVIGLRATSQTMMTATTPRRWLTPERWRSATASTMTATASRTTQIRVLRKKPGMRTTMLMVTATRRQRRSLASSLPATSTTIPTATTPMRTSTRPSPKTCGRSGTMTATVTPTTTEPSTPRP